MNQISPYAWPGMNGLHTAPTVAQINYKPEIIIDAVCEFYKVNLPMLQNGSRVRKYVKARHVAWYIIRELIRGITLKDMGRYFGYFDHSSVLHGLRKMETLLTVYPDLELEVKQITRLVKTL